MSAGTNYRLLDAGAYAPPADSPSAGLPPQRLAGGTVTTGRHGVSLPRLASLDREVSA